MSRRVPATLTQAAAQPAPGPGLFDFDPELVASLSELLRKLSLGLTTALVVARAYFPSEAIGESETGRGLGWILLILVAAALGIASLFVGGKTRIRWSLADVAVVLLMLCVAMSASHAPERRIGINLAWEWGGLALAYLLLRSLPRSRTETTVLAGILVASAVAVAVYGLYQVAVELPRLQAYYTANPERALKQAGVDPSNLPRRRLFESRLLGSKEPFATFALANSLAGYLVGATALALGVVLENLSRREGRGKLWRALGIATPPLLALLVCLLLTKSRSAYVGLAVAGLVLAWGYRDLLRTKKLALGAVVGAGILVALIGVLTAAGQLDRQVITEASKSWRIRWEYWQGAWGVINHSADRFWFGWGPGNFSGPYLQHKLAVASEEIYDPHNMVLEVWSTAGLPAVLALVAGLGLAFVTVLGRPITDAKVESAKPPAGGEGRPIWLLASGGIGGWILVVLLGGLDPFHPKHPELFDRWLVLAGGWILAIAGGALLWRRVPIPAVAAGAGALALCVNLLAAGGIGIPAVALMLWSLLALGQNLREDRPAGQLRHLGGRGFSFVMALVWASLIGIFVGAIGPHWNAEGLISEAEKTLATQRDLEGADEYYRQATLADLFASRAYIAMAQLTFVAWKDRGALPGDQAWLQISGDLQNAIKLPRNPHALVVEELRAQFSRTILEQGPVPKAFVEKLMRDRINACANRCMLYPTNALYFADLADALAATSQYANAAKNGREALRLDSVTPHKEKKLPRDLTSKLEASLPEWESRAAGGAAAQASDPKLQTPR
jgi:O-antigen ligase